VAQPGKDLDFLLIGAGKSGTTSLAGLLAQHPDIALTQPKEPWFFDTRDYDRGMAWYWQQYLGHYRGEAAVGEASSQTLFVPYAAERIARVTPGARLVTVLRDPVERAHSDWWMKYCKGSEPDDFDTAIRKNLDQIAAGIDFTDPSQWQEHIDSHRSLLRFRTYLDYGCYATQLSRYLLHFPREQLLILLTEELQNAPIDTMRGVCSFLGVEAGLPSGSFDTAPLNTSQSARIARYRRAALKLPGGNSLYRAARAGARTVLPRDLRRSVRATIARIDSGRRPPMSPATRALLADFYRQEVEGLEALLERRLPGWAVEAS
jgi:hypothetical protein